MSCGCHGAKCQLPPGDEKHGKRTGYAKHGCRCDACTDAQLAYQDEYRARRPRASYDATTYRRRKQRRALSKTT